MNRLIRRFIRDVLLSNQGKVTLSQLREVT